MPLTVPVLRVLGPARANERAGVSLETVDKNFGSKPGLVRALHDAMRGEGPVSPYRQSDSLRGHPNPYEVVRGWSRLSTKVAPRVSPILLLLRCRHGPARPA